MNKDKMKKVIKDYHIIPLIITGLILAIIDVTIILILTNIMYDRITNNNGAKIMIILINIFFICLYIYIIFTSIRQTRYKMLTGRNYAVDKRDYNMTYHSMVEFYLHNNNYLMNVEELPILDWNVAHGEILCKIKDKEGNYRLVSKPSAGAGNLITFGRPNCGKSTTQAATSAIMHNKDISNDGCGVFAISIKGDLLSFVKGKRNKIKVFTPDKAEGSCHYDLMQGVDRLNWTDRVLYVENMSLYIVQDEPSDNAKYFVDGSRACYNSVVLYLLHIHDTNEIEGKLRFSEIRRTILNSNPFDLLKKIHDCGNPIPGEYTNAFIGGNERNFLGIWDHLCKSIRPFGLGALGELLDGEGDCITPEYLNEGDIYIDVPQDKFAVYAPCMALIITNFIQSFMMREDVSSGKLVIPILFLLDEFPQLNISFSTLSTAMSTLRSKKVSLFLLMQSIAQLEGTYGEVNSRQIIDLCSYISIFNAQDPKSRKYFQELIGRQEVLRRSKSSSSTYSAHNSNTSGTSVNREKEYIFEASDFGNLNTVDDTTKETVYRALVYTDNKYVLGETIHYSDIPDKKDLISKEG